MVDHVVVAVGNLGLGEDGRDIADIPSQGVVPAVAHLDCTVAADSPDIAAVDMLGAAAVAGSLDTVAVAVRTLVVHDRMASEHTGHVAEVRTDHVLVEVADNDLREVLVLVWVGEVDEEGPSVVLQEAPSPLLMVKEQLAQLTASE